MPRWNWRRLFGRRSPLNGGKNPSLNGVRPPAAFDELAYLERKRIEFGTMDRMPGPQKLRLIMLRAQAAEAAAKAREAKGTNNAPKKVGRIEISHPPSKKP